MKQFLKGPDLLGIDKRRRQINNGCVNSNTEVDDERVVLTWVLIAGIPTEITCVVMRSAAKTGAKGPLGILCAISREKQGHQESWA